MVQILDDGPGMPKIQFVHKTVLQLVGGVQTKHVSKAQAQMMTAWIKTPPFFDSNSMASLVTHF